MIAVNQGRVFNGMLLQVVNWTLKIHILTNISGNKEMYKRTNERTDYFMNGNCHYSYYHQ